MRTASVLVLLAIAVACGNARSATIAPAEDAATTQAAVKPVPKELPAVLADVNGEVIERWEIESAIREIELMAGHPLPSSQRDEFVRAVLDRLIAHHLIAQEGRSRKLEVTEADVQADIARLRSQFQTQAEFDDALSDFRTTLDQLRRQRRLSLEVALFVRRTIEPTVSVKPQDIEAYYQENTEQFHEGEAVRADHILILALPEATPEQRAGARARAAAILGQLRGGADFVQLAREHSEDPGTAADGGDLGWVPRGRMDPAFEAAVFSLKAAELSDVVETPYGFHLIRVGERRDERTAPLSEVRPDIERLLVERAHQEALAAFVDQAKTKAKIEIFI